VRLAALRLLNAVDLNAVQSSGGGRVEARAGLHFRVYAGPIEINGPPGRTSSLTPPSTSAALSESLSNRLRDLLGRWIANVEDQVKINLCTHTGAMLLSLSHRPTSTQSLLIRGIAVRETVEQSERSCCNPRVMPSLKRRSRHGVLCSDIKLHTMHLGDISC
jgi:hypothetical protein